MIIDTKEKKTTEEHKVTIKFRTEFEIEDLLEEEDDMSDSEL